MVYGMYLYTLPATRMTRARRNYLRTLLAEGSLGKGLL